MCYNRSSIPSNQIFLKRVIKIRKVYRNKVKSNMSSYIENEALAFIIY